MWQHVRGIALAIAIVVICVSRAHAATWYVATDGVDTATCGPKATPCRSISQAIAQPTTVAGDTIVVGPGRYGDLDSDGVLGEPGEETPTPGCGCMIGVNKGVNLISSHGAASTVIDGRTAAANNNVLLIMTGGEFGRPGKGFTVTMTPNNFGGGIVIDAQDIAVRGNQVIAEEPNVRTGIDTVDANEDVLIEGNEAIGWSVGIRVRGPGKVVRKNLATQNETGIEAWDGDVVGNVVSANKFYGMVLARAVSATGNAVVGNLRYGIALASGFTGSATRNNVFGNNRTPFVNQALNCGVYNGGTVGAIATENYWGSPAGPGSDPADDVCNEFSATTMVSPVATKAYQVKAPLKQ